MYLSATIFLVTLLLVIVQPKYLKIGTSVILGAIAVYAGGLVGVKDLLEVWSIVWDATFAFIGIIILSLVLDDIGYFEWMAIKMAKLSNGSGKRMFVYSLILGAVVSALFANDGAALILTPILLAKMRVLKLNTKTIIAFLLAGGFISDSASLPFVFSNLTNIVTANFFHIGFVEYFKGMIIPFLVSVISSIIILYMILRKDIPDFIDASLLKDPKEVLKSKSLFYFSWFFLVILLFGYSVGDSYGYPVSLFALGGSAVFLFVSYMFKAVEPVTLIKQAPWQVVWFSLGLYIVVYGLKNAGWILYLEEFLRYLSQKSEVLAVLGTGFTSAFLSAFMNNLPTIMIMDISLKHIGSEAMIYANIIGCNIGPKMTSFGSLATLLWLHTLEKKGFKISFWEYSKFGVKVTVPVLLIVLLSLL